MTDVMDGADEALDLWSVLRDEAKAIHNVDLPQSISIDIYHSLNRLESAALCLSGGGIRSAAFALGVIQGFAIHPRQPPEQDEKPSDAHERSLLAQFHYLSTVSGGGYIGSWLSAWRSLAPFAKIWANLTQRPDGPDNEPPMLDWLRSYTNYLTPRKGLTSADTWAAAGLGLRNLLLNWLVILAPAAALIFLIKFAGVASNWTILWDDDQVWPLRAASPWEACAKPTIELAAGIAGTLCLLAALTCTTRGRPSCKLEGQGPTQKQFLARTMFWSLLSAILLVHLLASDLAGNLLLKCKVYVGDDVTIGALAPCPSPDDRGTSQFNEAIFHPVIHILGGIVFGALVWGAAWLLGRPRRQSLADLARWLVSGSTYGVLLSLLLYVYLVIPDQGTLTLPIKFLHLVFGVPLVLVAQVISDSVFVGLSSNASDSDADREWFGRASGWFLAFALIWFVLTFLVFFGTILSEQAFSAQTVAQIKTITPVIAGATGWITATLGMSSLTPVKGQGKGTLAYLAAVGLPFAAVVFVSTLLVVGSYLLDVLLFGQSLIDVDDPDKQFLPLLAGFIASAAVGAAASRFVNVNRFSLHSIYRNRLVRAFLGAARQRKPDPFTGFDPTDNPPMHQLWALPEPGNWRPFHIINIALNVVSTRRLAWQERKAEPFTVTALHSGSSYLGYRPSSSYGGQDGISLGTAMAISGAAASPNMGYYSSPSVTFLMSLFNVRLGWWLGNPGPYGQDTYRQDGPKSALLPLLMEALGLTTDNRKYVYLSDGGHFENLGLYEMIRRRCRFIVVSDAGCDPKCEFQDLGNAARKIALDLGVSIHFADLHRITNCSNGASESDCRSWAIGEIDYQAADGDGENGLILYIKPVRCGISDTAVKAYAAANSDFPHQSTLNQWFTESQFESYRGLGFETVDRILDAALAAAGRPDTPTLQLVLETLRRGLSTGTGPLEAPH
jgi:hypothetical protein